MLDALLSLSAQIKAQKLPTYRRFLYTQIDFSQRLIGVMGARGAGKTTLLLQYLQSLPTAQKSLYVIADHPLVEQHGLFEIANVFQQHGGEVLLIDEIHKHRGFERDLKLIYDSFFQLKVIFTGSSATAIDHAKADLSRRAMVYNLPILSFREFLELETEQQLPTLSLAQIITEHTEQATAIVAQVKPLAYFNDYLKYGAYPFYREAGETYLPRLYNASMQVLETDIPAIYRMDYDNINALKKLVVMLCQSEPYDVNMAKLCGAVGLNQKTLYRYLGMLQAAGILRLLGAKSSGVSIISKPDKLYLANTNLFAVFCNQPKRGTLRETFFASMLAYQHSLHYPKSADFIVDERYVFEIGGQSKGKKQLKDSEQAWRVMDDVEIGVLDKIPLWLFGFLY